MKELAEVTARLRRLRARLTADEVAPGWNPSGLTNAEVGDGFRLMTAEERSRKHAHIPNLDCIPLLPGAAWRSGDTWRAEGWGRDSGIPRDYVTVWARYAVRIPV